VYHRMYNKIMEEHEHTPTTAPYSIMAILRNDPDFSDALKKKTESVKKDKQALLQAAEQYSKKYEEEIADGTKNYHKLLGEGKVDGLEGSKELGGKFVPTKYTPILNFLFFALRDEDVAPKKTQEEIINDFLKQFTDAGFAKNELIDLYIKGIVDKLPAGYDDKEVDFDDVINEENTNDPAEMDTFIYGNLTHNEFKKLKKLKALSQSSNEQEAFLAYRKCLELCKKYSLEFDKIPCNVKKIE
jgi:hypothetical protein